jgi:hypothetical protein
MIYEVVKWKAEAIRIEQAFGVGNPCVWKQELLICADDNASAGDELETTTEKCLELAESQYNDIEISDDQFLHCIYDNEGRTFQVYEKECEKCSPVYNTIEISFMWNGTHLVSIMNSEKQLNLARGLFHLDLLTSEKLLYT